VIAKRELNLFSTSTSFAAQLQCVFYLNQLDASSETSDRIRNITPAETRHRKLRRDHERQKFPFALTCLNPSQLRLEHTLRVSFAGPSSYLLPETSNPTVFDNIAETAGKKWGGQQLAI